MRLAIVLGLLALSGAMSSLRAAAPPPPRSPEELLPLGPGRAWRMLPEKKAGLPSWALLLVRSMPRTTAAMLELDNLHRAKNPLGTVMAAKLRWLAADEIKCDYARQTAAADLKRALGKDTELKRLAGPASGLLPAERMLVTFARKMTRNASSVTDDEVAALIKRYGAEDVVAMVHTLAHANFQNRIFLALHVKVEPGGPLPPVGVSFDQERLKALKAPARPAWEEFQKAGNGLKLTAPAWKEFSFSQLEQNMETQKNRKARIPLPDKTKMARIPPQVRKQASRVIWSMVSMGYQPELTYKWFQTFYTFREEARFPRTFPSTMFWIITRSNDCFY